MPTNSGEPADIATAASIGSSQPVARAELRLSVDAQHDFPTDDLDGEGAEETGGRR
jgi:hypothetical protein